MTGRTLAFQFSVAGRAVRLNTDGVTHEESLHRPNPGGNSINWVVGHIIASRHEVLSLLGIGPVWDDVRRAAYARGSSGQVGSETVLPLKQLLMDLARTTTLIRDRLSNLSDDELLKPSSDSTLGERIAFLAFHESYHVGQLGLLRRLVGKPGAIR